ncbi:calcium-binding protein [Streptomyces sp. NPDC005811]|uniref:calcium-binding protein n=1 Tax=Streptomyces sp. NPDC005811 TaxID=3154565 RepID=UPI0033EB01C3
MRIRSLAAALTGALALSVLAVPAAHADGDTTITDVVVNGGAELALGPTAPKTFRVSVTARDNSGIREMNLHVRLPSYIYRASDRGLTCTAVSATTTTCSGSWTVDTSNFYGNGPADDPWYIEAYVYGKDGDWLSADKAATFTVRRQAKLTANASPEPVRKNATLTVTGKLTRANWETHKYGGYSGRKAKLQFRKAGTSTYTTVKTVTSGSGGTLKTTVRATADGYWRWYFPGDTTTSTAGATGDYIDVR